jgi:predicted transcriptional regulator
VDKNSLLEAKLDKIIDLLRQLVALEFSRRGASKELIGKRLHIAKSTVVEMLKGIKTE